ncbi:MAG: hypothetical protein KOO63_07995 [Bacteroidales bacterium]|nr:hypothetical protein [Candidatus Latescibacterota bacterium]
MPKKKIEINGKGTKFDFRDKKTRLELLPPNFTEAIGKVLTYGAEKYDAHNWMQGMEFSRLIGAMKRHLEEIEFSEDWDPETAEQHTAHIGCCLAFLHYFIEHPEQYEQFDDRVFERGTATAASSNPTLFEVLHEQDKSKKASRRRQPKKKAKKGTTKKSKAG